MGVQAPADSPDDLVRNAWNSGLVLDTGMTRGDHVPVALAKQVFGDEKNKSNSKGEALKIDVKIGYCKGFLSDYIMLALYARIQISEKNF